MAASARPLSVLGPRRIVPIPPGSSRVARELPSCVNYRPAPEELPPRGPLSVRSITVLQDLLSLRNAMEG